MPSSPSNTSSAQSLGPTKIAFLTTELGVGGAERSLVNLACGLDQDLYTPCFYVLAPPPSRERAELVDQLESAGISPLFFDLAHPRQFISAVRRVGAQLKRDQPKLLQSFLFHANVVGALATTMLSELPQITGIRVADPRRWRHRVERWSTKRCARIACVSQSVANFCETEAHFPKRKLVVIPNGVDFETVIAPALESPADLTEFGIASSRKTILFVGRLDRQKGVDWLIDWISDLFEQRDDCDLLMVGDGDQREALTLRREQHPFAERIHLAGWQSGVQSIMAAATCLVLPSRWEGMPNALMEAMALGKPVVASNVEGVLEVLGPSFEQQCSAVGDRRDFTEKLTAILANSELARSLGQQNAERISEVFSVEAMIQRYSQLYQQVLRESVPAS